MVAEGTPIEGRDGAAGSDRDCGNDSDDAAGNVGAFNEGTDNTGKDGAACVGALIEVGCV